MSNYNIISRITLEIQKRVYDALSSMPDTDLGLTSPDDDITISAPSEDPANKFRLSIYLYHLDQDGHLRNQKPMAIGTDGLRLPPIGLQLYYLITPLDDSENHNHLILGRILQYFHDTPVIESLNGSPLDNSFGANSPELRIGFEPLSLEQLTQVWNALDTSYRLSIAYRIQIVTIDSATGITEAKRVIDAYTAVGHKQG